ncbi:hypothetical protein [Ruegeria jejuensis]|uniref:hypothetical protein n=1 Tax=Ruegeria jejuensis TaxID=3233338 RepID=UPI00355C5626
MKLTFERMDGPGAGDQRMTDGATPFTIGTGPGVTWMLPAEEQAEARLSVRRAGGGFVAEASGNVLIEGHPVPEGHEVAIHHGATVILGAHKLRARVDQSRASEAAGVTDLFADPATPTISAILSDVAPGGEDASGPLPGRGGEEWLDGLLGQAPDPGPRNAGWDQLGTYGAGREATVELEDSLPSHPDHDPVARVLLPDDWNSETPAPDRFQQIAAPREGLSLAATQARATPSPAIATKRGPGALKPLHDALGIYEGEVDAPEAAQLANAGEALRVALDGLSEVEALTNRVLGDLDVDPPRQDIPARAAFEPAILLSDPAGLSVEVLSTCLARIVARQAALTETLVAALTQAREDLAPETITHHVTATGGVAARLRPTTEAWREYRARWCSEEAALNPETLARALRDALIDPLERQNR